MLASTLATAVLVINELMASNAGSVMSPAINFDSWIELYNPSDQAVNLSGMYLSDDASNLQLWKMPSGVGSVPAKGFKVIWLGSNDIKATQAPFKLDCDGGTVYLSDANGQLLVTQVYPEAKSRTAWARTTDGGDEWEWTSTPTPEATNATAVFASERLAAPEVSVDSRLFSNSLQVKVNIPEGTRLMYTTDGSLPAAPSTEAVELPWIEQVKNGNCEGTDASNLLSKNGESSSIVKKITDGVGVDGSRGIQVHSVANATKASQTQFFVYTPNYTWKTNDRFRFRMKVRADKAARITAIAQKKYGENIGNGVSMLAGAYDVTTEWQEIVYEGTLTAEQAGEEQGWGGWWGWGEPTYSLKTIAFNLNEDKTLENYYYFDDISWESLPAGYVEAPSKESEDGMFTIASTTNLTFRLYKDGFLPSVPVTRSYIKTSNNYTLPVISIVGDKKFFTDPKIGLDCDGDGTNGKTGNGQNQPKNYNCDWDRPVNISYISPDGEMLHNQDVNIKVSGGWTRSQTYRSFKLKASKIFDGQNRYDYSFFPQKPYIRSKTLLVRNGGNDFWVHNARFIDPALETIIQRSGIDVDVQSYVPVIEYVNGELRGVLNLREPNNDDFAYANWGYDDEELDAFENLEIKNGDNVALNRIFELGRQINAEGAYEELQTLLDVDEFINYMATTMFLGNDDWPNNNIKGYRSRLDGRYRLVSFDLDYAFGLRNFNKDKYNNADDPFTYFVRFKDASTVYDESNRNREIVRLMLNLMGHDEFRRKFIDTFCLVAGSVFEPTRAGQIVDELLAKVQSMCDLMRQIDWNLDGGHHPENAANEIKNKLKDRAKNLTDCLQKKFSYAKLSSSTRQAVTLKSDAEGARLFVNGINVPYADFKGYLFTPVTLKAEAPAGYRFAGWKQGGNIISTDAETSLPSGSSVSLTATFTKLSDDELAAEHITPVRINEVSASNGIHVNDYFKRNDWVELYNTTSAPIDVEGMYLSDNIDKPKKYKITKGNTQASTVIPAHGFLVVWCDKLAPLSQLHASFKLSNGNADVLLTAADESWTDRFTYSEMKSDETAGRYPDGTGQVVTMNIPTIACANIISSYAQPIVQPAVEGILDLAISSGLDMRYVSGSLVISGAADDAVNVSIVSLSGRKAAALSTRSMADYAAVSVENLAAGAYVAVVTDGRGHRAVCKFIKEN